eukprot:5986688-Lingulodinium_polyedra.AAC.1
MEIKVKDVPSCWTLVHNHSLEEAVLRNAANFITIPLMDFFIKHGVGEGMPALVHLSSGKVGRARRVA